MDPNDRQRFKILFILLAVLVATVWVGRQIYQVPQALPVNGGEAGLSAVAGVRDSLSGVNMDTDLSTRMSLLDNEIGRNPFQYGPEPVPPPAAVDEPQELTPRSADTPQPPGGVTAPAPPPPPPIPFRYNGYAVIDPSDGIRALLFDDDRSFAVSEDDVVMGRYRVNVVTEAFVEIEDLEFGRRQRLPLITQ